VKGPILILLGPINAWSLYSVIKWWIWKLVFSSLQKIDWWAKSDIKNEFYTSLNAKEDGWPKIVKTTVISPS